MPTTSRRLASDAIDNPDLFATASDDACAQEPTGFAERCSRRRSDFNRHRPKPRAGGGLADVFALAAATPSQ